MKIPVTLRWLVPGLVVGVTTAVFVYNKVFDTVRGPEGGMIQNLRVLKNPGHHLAEYVALDRTGDTAVVTASKATTWPGGAGKLFVWNVPSGEIARTYGTAFLSTLSFAISPGGNYLIMPTLIPDAIPNSNYEKWRDSRGVRFAILQPHTRSMGHVPPTIPAELDSWHSAAAFPTFSADGQLMLVTGSTDKKRFGIYEVGSWRRVAVGGSGKYDRTRGTGFITSEAVSFTDTGNIVDTFVHEIKEGRGGTDLVIGIRHLAPPDFTIVQEIPIAYKGQDEAYAIDPAGPRVAIGGIDWEFFASGRETPTASDRAIRVWYLGDEPREQVLRNERGRHTEALIFTRDGRYLLSVDTTFGEEAVLQVWDLSMGEVVELYELPRAVSRGFHIGLALSRDGRRLAMAYMDRTYVWDVIPRSEGSDT